MSEGAGWERVIDWEAVKRQFDALSDQCDIADLLQQAYEAGYNDALNPPEINRVPPKHSHSLKVRFQEPGPMKPSRHDFEDKEMNRVEEIAAELLQSEHIRKALILSFLGWEQMPEDLQLALLVRSLGRTRYVTLNG